MQETCPRERVALHRSWRFACALASLVSFVWPASFVHADELHSATTVVLRDGEFVKARLQGLDDSGQWRFRRSGELVTWSNQQLSFWGAYVDKPSRSWVLLSDGSLLVAELLRIEADSVVVAGRLWPETRLPRASVRALIFRPALDPAVRDALVFRALTERRTEDQLLLEHGDELRGTTPDEVFPEPGAFHAEKVMWPVAGALEPVELSLDRVTALLFAADRPVPRRDTGAETGAEGPVQWIGMRDGSRLLASKVTRKKDVLHFELSCGTQLATGPMGDAGANPCEAIVFLQPIGNDVTYLSDLEPMGYKHIPFLAAHWPYHRDRSVLGGHLRGGEQVFLKGVGMHSSSRLAYDLPGQYHTLLAELAIDGSAGREGSVVFRVYVQHSDGQWSKAYESPVVRGGQAPVPMRVELQNAQRVALIVDFADRTDQRDHADWLNVRLLR